MISLDVANDKVKGDLTRPDAIALWVNMLISRRAIGALGGPPCETWSAVRHVRVMPKGKSGGPRPIRHRNRPWGLKDISMAERQQINIGNALMRTTYIIMQVCLAMGAPAVLEHPATAPWQPDSASTWLLPVALPLLSSGAVLHTIDQCSLGARSKKPTGLLAVAFPELNHAIASHDTRCQCPGPWHKHIVAVGKDADGNYLTAPLKQYPRALCNLLAKAFHKQIQSMCARLSDIASVINGITDDAACFFIPLDPFCTEQAWDQFCHDCAA